MPQDPLQIALEHHRAGRLRQAESGYRGLLAQDPSHPDAAHWLGVLLYQAGQAEQAIPLLERATAGKPDDAAFHHNLGQAYVGAGRAGDAVAAFERAAALAPDHVETLVALGLAHLARRPEPDAPAAVDALRRAQAAGLDTAESHHDLGVALLAAGQADEAIAAFRAALAKDAYNASAYHHLALAHRAKGEPKDVRKCLIKALEIDQGLARSWYALGALDAEAGNLAQAAGSFRRAVRARADYAAAYEGLARVLEEDGKPDEARQAFEMAERAARGEIPRAPDPLRGHATRPASVEELEQRITPDEQTERLHYALAGVTNLVAPMHLPADRVATLFDEYADRFDEHLQAKLGYRVPEMIADAVAAEKPGRPLDTFDLGCGTGLVGPLVRPLAATLRGVDLSPAMVDKARERNVYDELEVGDLVESLKRTTRAFDLLTAADVLIYVGDLAPVMEAAATALRPGGLFVFSVEATGGDRFHLQKRIRRYAHSRPYLQHVAAIYGFEQRSVTPVTLRFERGQPVPGYIVVLALPAE